MARHFQKNAKRASKANPREDRNTFNPDFFNRDAHSNVISIDKNSKSYAIPRPKKPFVLVPKTVSQETYIDILEDEQVNYVIAYGSAGTGKTYLCMMSVLRDLVEGNIGKIFLVRSLTTVDKEAIGYLPGTKMQKISEFNIAFFDILKAYFTDEQIEKMIDNDVIEFAPISFMRGRNLGGEETGPCAVIIDEAQNTSPAQLKAVLSRLTFEGSRMYILGDTKQNDRGLQVSGLTDLIDRLKSVGGHENFATHQFFPCDSVRHPLTKFVLNMYGEED